MTSIDWNRIDDREFVYLTADLLRKMGFVDLLVQGTGPDGGLDLIATELVSFAIQGQQPFKWGIQCKFSTTGTRMSVNDNEIRDVTGILSSDRYSSHYLRGYMVVTNRNIVQNVVERLRGIDRSSAFRTAYLDGHELQHKLDDHPEIVKKYFGEAKTVIRNLGQPIVTGHRRNSVYIVEIQVKSPIGDMPITLKAAVDTGADISTLPEIVVAQLGQLDYSHLNVEYSSGESRVLKSCFVDLRFTEGEWFTLQVLTLDSDMASLGQDFLKHFTVLLDTTTGIVKLWQNVLESKSGYTGAMEAS
jgi:hypothetical protein